MSTRRRNVRTQLDEELAAEEAAAQQQESQSPEGGVTTLVPTAPRPDSTFSRELANQKKTDRSSQEYTKVTYRLSNDAVQAAEDMKALLKRRYGFKRVNLEEVVEEAILAARRDLEEHQEQGFLVQQLRQHKNPANQ